MECHKCPFAEALARGEHRDLPYADTPCATCPAGNESSYAIEYDDTRALPESEPQADCETEDLLPVSVLTDMATGILRLPSELRDVVSQRLAGHTYRQIADAEQISIQAAEQRHKRALKQWPALRELFPRKTAKKMSKRHRARKHRSQIDLPLNML